MQEHNQENQLIEKIARYDMVEILVNEKKEMVFDDIIDPVYIHMHFERIVNTSRDFDIVKMIGHHGSRSKEVIAEVFVSR